MTIAQQIGRVVASTEAQGRIAEFVSGTRFLMLARTGADTMAEKERAPSRVVDFCKTATAAGSTVVGNWGQPLAPFQSLATAFLSSLSSISVFDRLLPDMLIVPLRSSVVAVSATLTAGAVAESNIKPASRISLTASDVDVTKCAAFLAVSAELLRSGTPSALALLQRELRIAIARCTNSVFLPILAASATSFTSSGLLATAVRHDLRVLLATVSSGSDSKLYFITTRAICEALAILPSTDGGPAFPDARVDGGSIAGVPIIPCDEVTTGEIILVDASQVAAGSEGMTLDTSTQATLNLDVPGDSPPTAATSMTSLWQNDLAALRAERFIGAKVLRSDAVAKITGAGYTGGSPA